jgi:hypothetical protein
MTKEQYTAEMINRNRCFFIKVDGKCRGLITYFLCNGDVDRFIHKEPWEVLDDKNDGDTCYTDVLLTDKQKDNPCYSFQTWRNFKKYIGSNHPNVNRWIWRRYKNDKVYEFKREVRNG